MWCGSVSAHSGRNHQCNRSGGGGSASLSVADQATATHTLPNSDLLRAVQGHTAIALCWSVKGELSVCQSFHHSHTGRLKKARHSRRRSPPWAIVWIDSRPCPSPALPKAAGSTRSLDQAAVCLAMGLVLPHNTLPGAVDIGFLCTSYQQRHQKWDHWSVLLSFGFHLVDPDLSQNPATKIIFDQSAKANAVGGCCLPL